jgi:hypothetical protein
VAVEEAVKVLELLAQMLQVPMVETVATTAVVVAPRVNQAQVATAALA